MNSRRALGEEEVGETPTLLESWLGGDNLDLHLDVEMRDLARSLMGDLHFYLEATTFQRLTNFHLQGSVLVMEGVAC